MNEFGIMELVADGEDLECQENMDFNSSGEPLLEGRDENSRDTACSDNPTTGSKPGENSS